MGKGARLASELFGSREHAALLDDLKDQLLIVFLKRLGGAIDMPVSEVDDTAQDLFAFSVYPQTKRFHFEIRKKD